MNDTVSYSFLLTAFQVTNLLFACAFGACIGSLINVLVYRIPLGLGVVTPPSRCPNCETRLTWRENIPIFGWLLLGGKCRFCRSPVSSEYPIVEAFVAALFGLIYLKLYAENGIFLGSVFGPLQPEWAWGGFRETWPMLIIVLILTGSLTAATLIDARTFQIPMILTWVPAIFGLVVHPLHALYVQYSMPGGRLLRTQGSWDWTITTPGDSGWWWVGIGLGGMLGVGLSNLLLATEVFTRSFSDYEAWLKTNSPPTPPEPPPSSTPPTSDSLPSSSSPTSPESLTPVSAPAPANSAKEEAQLWLEYPFARREMLREIIFLAPIIGLALAGGWLAMYLTGPWTISNITGETVLGASGTMVPLWLKALSGSCLGFLIGGAIVWVWRILGTLAVGREALGLGDVHLMAAVGACLGWADSVLGFFAAAFVGVFWTFLGKLFTGTLQRQMPFGPYLAIGTMLVWYFKPFVEKGISLILQNQGTIHLP